MNLELPEPGAYVVAVSGGVDSMALLHMLTLEASKNRDWKLTVAHLDHGIRPESRQDRELVHEVSRQYGLAFVYDEAGLGPGASEAEAREVRYQFLDNVKTASGAKAIITAHHQDDALETAILNMLRGTGRKGLSSLQNRPGIVRPLLKLSKKEMVDYAKSHDLRWNEDATNLDTNYMRNYIRHNLLTKFSTEDRHKLIQLINKTAQTNNSLDGLIADVMEPQVKDEVLDRLWFSQLPHDVAREVLASWFRANDVGFDRNTLERLVVVAKVAAAGKMFPIQAGRSLRVSADKLALA